MYTIAGFEELEKMLKELPDEGLSKTDILQGIRPAAKFVLDIVKKHTPIAEKYVVRRTTSGKVAAVYQPGNLMRSMTIFKGKSKTNPNLQVGASEGYNQENDGWYLHFITSGTSERVSQKKKKGKKYGRIEPNNFIEKAYNDAVDTAQAMILEKMFKKIDNHLQKYGAK